MADKTEKQTATPPQGSKGSGPVLAIIVPALAAAAATFGGTFWSTRMVAARCGGHEAPSVSVHVEATKPPGPTLPLDAFLLNVPDSAKKAHPMKVTMAVEFAEDAKLAKDESAFKTLVPRLRDAILSYLRRLTYEDVSDPAVSDQMRADLVDRVRTAGATGVERILITDLVVQ
jgi:flagellar basal body-associated protein FliL